MSFAAASPLGQETGRMIAERYDLKRRLERATMMVLTQPLPRLLRSHLDTPIRQREIRERDNLDELLAGLSVLHIGGFDTPDQFEALGLGPGYIMEVLGDSDVMRYYEAYYPYAPPILLREMLAQGFSPAAFETYGERRDEGWCEAFRRFLLLDVMFNTEGPLEYFLSILDSYVIESLDFSDLEHACSDEAHMRRLLKSDTGRMLVEGLEDFLEFSEELDAFLESCANYPLFRGLVWLNYGYWYGAGGERMRGIAEWITVALDQLAARGDKEFEPGIDQFARLKQAMERLTDLDFYAQPVFERYHEELARWKYHVLGAPIQRGAN